MHERPSICQKKLPQTNVTQTGTQHPVGPNQKPANHNLATYYQNHWTAFSDFP